MNTCFQIRQEKEEQLLNVAAATIISITLEHVLEIIATNVAHNHLHHLQNTREERIRKDNAVRSEYIVYQKKT